jgi:hypothetical protein
VICPTAALQLLIGHFDGNNVCPRMIVHDTGHGLMTLFGVVWQRRCFDDVVQVALLVAFGGPQRVDQVKLELGHALTQHPHLLRLVVPWQRPHVMLVEHIWVPKHCFLNGHATMRATSFRSCTLRPLEDV